jgi:hypothetical protein
VLPDVHREQRHLPLVSGVSAFGVLVTASLPPSSTSQAQPLPNCVAPAALNASTNLA